MPAESNPIPVPQTGPADSQADSPVDPPKKSLRQRRLERQRAVADRPPPPPYRWALLRAGRFLLDGGGMFGVIPRVVWSRTVEPDDKNRIELLHNCLLIEALNPKTGKPRRVIIETGTGDKLDEKMSGIFGLDGTTIETALRAHGTDPADIDAVVVSHLHFDHAGGLTRRCREGETPDWVATKPGAASGDNPNIKFTFPNAELIVQKREWVDARANDAVMTRTYYRDHLLPFEDDGLALRNPDGSTRPRLRVVESERPFPTNRKPSRNELPKTDVMQRRTEVLPGVWTFLVPGHTWGQQAVMFNDAEGNTVVFVPDVMPTRWHAGQAYSLSYDVEPYTSMVTKHWLLHEAAERNWLLVLDHEPGDPVCRVRRNDKGWFDLVHKDTPPPPPTEAPLSHQDGDDDESNATEGGGP
ncbi:MAG: MBL fold metallo-hydrolase [Planctomycetota bacterium]